MANRLNISFDSDMLESISAEFDLRAPNKEALRQLVFTLDGDYDPTVMQVLNLATGVGKTYLMAAFSVAQTSLPSSCGRKQTRREVTLNVFRWIKM